MAILRDAKTGQGVAQGDPEELIHVFDATDSELIWDDVGEKFDPDAVRKAQEERHSGLEDVLKEKDLTKEVADSLKEQLSSEKKAIEDAEATAPDVDARVKKAHETAESLHS